MSDDIKDEAERLAMFVMGLASQSLVTPPGSKLAAVQAARLRTIRNDAGRLIKSCPTILNGLVEMGVARLVEDGKAVQRGEHIYLVSQQVGEVKQ